MQMHSKIKMKPMRTGSITPNCTGMKTSASIVGAAKRAKGSKKMASSKKKM